jgi:Zn-finger nucleic acid-binding protein
VSTSPTPLCPRCGTERLVRHILATGGIVHQCPRCHGTQMSLAVLRGRNDDTLAPRLWAEVGTNPRPGIACPLCRRSSSALMTDGVELDLCRPCQSLWFDADELERFPVHGAPTRSKSVVDTSKQPATTRRSDPDTEDEGSVVVEVVDVLFQVLTSWH